MNLQERIRKVLKEETTKEIEKTLRSIRTVLSQVSWEGLCDISVEYCKEDNDYEIKTKSIKRDENSDDTDIVDELTNLGNILRSMGIKVSFYAPLRVDSCEDESKYINESTFFRRRVDLRLMEKEFYETLNFATDMFLKRRNVGINFTFEGFKKRVIDYLMDDYHDMLSNGGSKDFPYDEVYEFLSNHFHDKIKERYYSLFDQETTEEGELSEKWSEKYKKSINCNNPKGFSQRAHCQGKRKQSEMKEGELTERCWKGYTQKGMKTMFGKQYPNCVKKTK
jgi:hypothetical protein